MFGKILLVLTFTTWCVGNAQAQSFAAQPQPAILKVVEKAPAATEAPKVEAKTENKVEEIAPLPELPPSAPTPEQIAQAKKPLLDEIDYSTTTYPTQEKKEILRVINNLEKREKQRLQNIGSDEATTAPDGQHQVDVDNVEAMKAFLQDKFISSLEAPKVEEPINE